MYKYYNTHDLYSSNIAKEVGKIPLQIVFEKTGNEMSQIRTYNAKHSVE